MTNVASKNPYDLLGNDPEQDEDRAPEPPTKVIDKPVGRTGKRNAGAEGVTGGAQRGGGRGGRGDQAGSFNDRAEKRDDRQSDRPREPREHRGGDRGGRGRGRGERGERGEGRGRGFSGRFQRTNRDDRADHTGIGSHDKQAAQGWGDEKSGTAEWNDEKAGDEIARAESKDEPGFTPDTSAGDPAFTNGPGAPGEIVDENAAPEEPEDKTKSYDEYLAEQKEKRAALGNDSLSVRKANEGSKQKFPEGTVASRNAAEENFFEGSGGKTKREKTNQQGKQTLTIDGQYYANEASDRGDRGGRGRGRGRGGPRGEFRGDRGDRGDRGGRGEYRGDRGEHRGRGGRGRGERGEFRGAPRGDRGDRGDRPDRSDRGGSRGGFNATDQSAFPALGGS